MNKCSICTNEIYTEHGHNAEPINNGNEKLNADLS